MIYQIINGSGYPVVHIHNVSDGSLLRSINLDYCNFEGEYRQTQAQRFCFGLSDREFYRFRIWFSLWVFGITPYGNCSGTLEARV